MLLSSDRKGKVDVKTWAGDGWLWLAHRLVWISGPLRSVWLITR